MRSITPRTSEECRHSCKIVWSTLLRLPGCFLCLALVGLSGCGGCLRDSQEKLTREELEQRAKERRESLELSELISLPADSERKQVTAKPGHWIETQQSFKSNREDLQVLAVEEVVRGSEPIKIPGTNFTNAFTRRTSLPQGQTKTVDLQCFIPFSGKKADVPSSVSSQLNIKTELQAWPLMTPILQFPSIMPANELKEHEFQLVVLSPKALSYKFVSALDAVFWQGENLMLEERTRSYYVTLVEPADNSYPFPRSMLTMTSIAVILWDDVSPDDLSENQKNALVDWIHWGGQLIVSGAGSWARLQNSFLSPYLPASSADSTALNSEDFQELSATWMVGDLNPRGIQSPIQIVGDPIAGLQLQLNEKGSWLPGSGDMVAESQVGRGRIVVTCFPLNEPQLFNWNYFSSFFSTGLLRRHPRQFRPAPETREPVQFWSAPYQNSERDARMHSNLRILTRDLPLSLGVGDQLKADELDGIGGTEFNLIAENAINTPAVQRNLAEGMQWGGRGAAWNDYSGMSFEAMEALKSAAGIELPSKRTIVYLLGGYLFCLVPLNWFLFRLMGKLEFAWIAAPVMAIVGVVIVTRVARLDIGFARRTTEISVLELQASHPRGHLTQYLGLYTSLSVDYSVDFPENDSVALPLGDISRTVRRAGAENRNLRTNFGLSEGVTLEPLTVYSSSTEMIHAEQIVSLEGGLRLGNRSNEGKGAEAIKNETGLNLRATMILRRTRDDSVEMAWVGDLLSNQTVTLRFVPATTDLLWENWKKELATQPDQPAPESKDSAEIDTLWIGGILKEVVRKTPLMPGQTRLFAYTNDRSSQLTLSPKEDQYDGRCIVVAHLTPQDLGVVVPDLNIRSRRSSSQIDSSNKDALDAELEQFRPDLEKPVSPNANAPEMP